MKLSKIEWLGVELAAQRFLDLERGEAKMLAEMLRRAPAVVSLDALAELSHWRGCDAPERTNVRVTVCKMRKRLIAVAARISRMRSLASDLGAPLQVINVPLQGYYIPRATAEAVLRYILDEVEGRRAEAA
jgi:hypothetical protein